MTYGREIMKRPLEPNPAIHAPPKPNPGSLHDVAITNADLTDPGLVYTGLLQQYIKGDRQPAFLKRLARTASQVGDKPGARQAGADYIASLTGSLSEEDIHTVVQFTGSTTDPGFRLMTDHAEAFRKVLGDRPYTIALMNSIYKGEIDPLVTTSPIPTGRRSERR